MKVYGNKTNSKETEGMGPCLTHKHINPERPILPHERNALIHIEFEDSDWDLLRKIFEDEDTAMAAVEIISNSPPEIQVLAIQLIYLIKEAA